MLDYSSIEFYYINTASLIKLSPAVQGIDGVTRVFSLVEEYSMEQRAIDASSNWFKVGHTGGPLDRLCVKR